MANNNFRISRKKQTKKYIPYFLFLFISSSIFQDSKTYSRHTVASALSSSSLFSSKKCASDDDTNINNNENESNHNHPSNNPKNPKTRIKPTPCTRICRYNSNFYDGQVCIGCFRDTTEIAAWSQMSHLEKGYALEDAYDRCNTCTTQRDSEEASASSRNDIYFEAAIDASELKQQAQAWFDLSSMSVDNVNASSSKDDKTTQLGMDKNNHAKNRQMESFFTITASTTPKRTEPEELKTIPIPSSQPTTAPTPTQPAFLNLNKENHNHIDSSNIIQETIDELQIPSPCTIATNLCEFDSNFCEGQICKKCFRDTFEIQHWNQFTMEKKIITLQDVADRFRDYQK